MSGDRDRARRSEPHPAHGHGLWTNRLLVGLVLAVVAWRVWTVVVEYMPLQVAWGGWSPLHWVYVTLDPAKSALDWPAGVRHYAKSLWMWIYPGLAAVGIDLERVLPLTIALEILVWVGSFGLLFRTVAAPMPRGAGLVALLAASFGAGVDLNLARFVQPFYVGLYYAVATALRNLGWVMALRGTWVWAGLWSGLAFTVHPTLGLIGWVGIVGMAAGWAYEARRRDEALPWRTWLLGGGVAVAIAGTWYMLGYGGIRVGLPGSIPRDLWYQLTRTINSHWYPLERGVFTVHHTQRFLPALSMWCLAFPVWARLPSRDRSVLAGLWSIGILAVVAGVAVSALSEPPTPVLKLALHRASDLVTYTSLPLAVAFLWRLTDFGGPWLRVPLLVLFVSPWLSTSDRGWPALLTIGVLACYGFRMRGQEPIPTRWARWSAAALSCVVLAYTLAGLVRWASASYTGYEPLVAFVYHVGMLPGLLALAGLAAFAIWRPRVAAVALAIALAWSWADRRYGAAALGPVRIAEREDYLSVQRWARTHTPATALFMPPPDIIFGWRDFSRRPSFGNVYEWLHTSWLYETDARLFREGLRRFGTLGLDLDRYLRLPRQDWSATRTLITDLRLAYGTRDDTWRQALARRYGIDYFVLWAHHPAARATTMPVVYRNDHFVVLATKERAND